MEEKREFSMSYPVLIQKADHFINLANRDKDVLIGYGMADTMPDDTQTKRDEFADMPTDEEMQSSVEVATEERNNARKEVVKDIKDIVNRAELCFGKGTPIMKRFKTGTIDDLTDAECYRMAGRIIRAATKLLDKLSANGLTQEMLTASTGKNNVFDDLIDEKEDSENERKAATAERINTANNLYSMMVKISQLGKSAFEGKDPVKAAEYLLGD